jgi:hypothetical protein
MGGKKNTIKKTIEIDKEEYEKFMLTVPPPYKFQDFVLHMIRKRIKEIEEKL